MRRDLRAAEFIEGIILSNTEVARDIHLIEIAPDPSGKLQLKTQYGNLAFRSEQLGKAGSSRFLVRPYPGQFYHFLSGEEATYERVLRRPLSVLDATGWGLKGFDEYANKDSGDFRLYFLIEVAGAGTRWLCGLEEGFRVDMLGPLGRGFPFFEFEKSGYGDILTEHGDPRGSCPNDKRYGTVSAGEDQDLSHGRHNILNHVLLISGGMGIVPIYYAARELERLKLNYSLIAGFKSGERLFSGVYLLEGDVRVYTEDGTYGTKGIASDGFSDLDMSLFSAVFACGPNAMMRKASDMARAYGIPCYISLTARMGCGVGFCGCCVVKGSKRNLHVCSDGPVFISKDFFI